MTVTKLCWYKTRHYNLWPALIILPTDEGLIIQFKFWNRHAGLAVSINPVGETPHEETT